MSSTTSSLEWARQMSDHIEQLNQSNKFLGERLEAQAETMAKVVGERNELREERERLREAATRALAAFRYMRDVDTQWWDFHVTSEICTAWDKLRAALNDQKGE